MLFYPRAVVRLIFQLDMSIAARVSAILPPGWRRFVEGAANILPTIAGTTIYTLDLTPRDVRVTLNRYGEADKARITIDFARFPFDPRIALAITAWVHFGAVPTIDTPLFPRESNRLFMGYVDKGNWRQDDDGTITFEARDYTALFLDRPYSGEQLDLTKPISKLVEQIAAAHPSTANLRIEARADATLAEVKGDVGGQMHSGETTQNSWEYIASLCTEAGLVAWIDQDRIIIDELQIFQGAAPAFVYGRNLKSIEVDREIGHKKTPPVTVVSWDPTTRTNLSATWPKQTIPPQQGDGKPDAPKGYIFTLSNIKNKRHLEIAARRIYQRYAMQDIQIDLETNDMTTVDGADLLALRPGHLATIFFTRQEQQFLNDKTLGESTAYLRRQGYSPAVAAAIAAAYKQLPKVYSCSRIEHRMDHRNGYSFRLRAISYIPVGPLG